MSQAKAPASRLAVLAARLAHDVGKYVARIAHNVAPDQWTPELAAMLCRDLFELRGGRASAVFATLARPIEELSGPCIELTRTREQLAQIDALEVAVRAGDAGALAQAAALALAVEDGLRKLAGAFGKGSP
jgi:hypothetical protein